MLLYVNDKLVADELIVAESFYDRFKGFMFAKSVRKGEGMLFRGCNWIHSFFMKFPIDVLYLDRNNKIIDITQGLDPWSLCMPRFKASQVIELWPGSVEENNITRGGVASVSVGMR